MVKRTVKGNHHFYNRHDGSMAYFYSCFNVLQSSFANTFTQPRWGERALLKLKLVSTSMWVALCMSCSACIQSTVPVVMTTHINRNRTRKWVECE